MAKPGPRQKTKKRPAPRDEDSTAAAFRRTGYRVTYGQGMTIFFKGPMHQTLGL